MHEKPSKISKCHKHKFVGRTKKRQKNGKHPVSLKQTEISIPHFHWQLLVHCYQRHHSVLTAQKLYTDPNRKTRKFDICCTLLSPFLIVAVCRLINITITIIVPRLAFVDPINTKLLSQKYRFIQKLKVFYICRSPRIPVTYAIERCNISLCGNVYFLAFMDPKEGHRKGTRDDFFLIRPNNYDTPI